MSIRYIGSKRRLAPAILDLVGPPGPGRFVDPFAGTGAVAREAATRGFAVRAGDLLPSAATLTRARLTAADDAPFTPFGGYEAALAALSDAPDRDGFFTAECAPSGRSGNGVQRRYFTVDNARRIDGIRAAIAAWSGQGLLTDIEEALLLGDLIEATNRVANTAGTYGCFLRRWSPNARKPLRVVARDLLPRPVPFEVTVGDAASVETHPDDVLYLDPPYTKRQYAAYYHVLETLVAGDAPAVDGITGLRPWRDRASAFCHKRRALTALTTVLQASGARRVWLSYSDDGHVTQAELVTTLGELGEVTVHALGPIRRYTPNAVSRRREAVGEVLVELRRSPP